MDTLKSLKCGDPCVVQAVKAINESVAQVVINVSYGVLETCNYRFSNNDESLRACINDDVIGLEVKGGHILQMHKLNSF